uniref:Uncharacterized protein n=1 Tax=Tanacetum cinerariifolium TaxID=118510 RepID=A0A6L2JA71_TANCI|nr:hypothetical protein [Tanacetum cinerariifolium]
MDITIDQQVALDEAFVPHASRLRISKSNFQLRSDIKSKESTLQVVYDVLKLTPFYKAFLVTADFDELPFEDEILAFLLELGHSGEIKMITDVAHKDAKKSNEMYYPWFTKVIVNFFMTKDQSIPRRNKVNRHFAMDDHMFTTIKLVSRHQNTQQYGAILPVELTNKAIRNSESYKEYYAIASGAEPPKTKAIKVGKPAKEKQPAKSSKAKGLTVLSEVALIEAEQIKLATKRSLTQTHISYASGSDDEDNNKDNHGMNVEGDEGANEEDEANELYRDANVNLEGQQQSSSVSSRFVSNMLNPSPDTGIDSIFESTPRVDVLVTTTAEPPLLSETTLPPPSILNISHVQQTPSFSPANMNEAVKVAVRLQLDRLRDEAQAEIEDFLNKLDENIQKIIKEQVKEQVKVQVSKILPKTEKTINEQLEAEEFETGATDDQPVEEASQHPNWFKKQAKPPTPYRAWNKTLPATHGRIQPWISNLAKKADSRTSFNELMDTHVDFSAFMMNRLKVDTLTPDSGKVDQSYG